MQLGPCKIEIERKEGGTRLAAEGLAALLTIAVGATILGVVVYLGLQL